MLCAIYGGMLVLCQISVALFQVKWRLINVRVAIPKLFWSVQFQSNAYRIRTNKPFFFLFFLSFSTFNSLYYMGFGTMQVLDIFQPLGVFLLIFNNNYYNYYSLTILSAACFHWNSQSRI